MMELMTRYLSESSHFFTTSFTDLRNRKLKGLRYSLIICSTLILAYFIFFDVKNIEQVFSIPYADRIREFTSDKQRKKVFSVLALSKQRSKMVEASRCGVASARMVIFIGLKILSQNRSVVVTST